MENTQPKSVIPLHPKSAELPQPMRVVTTPEAANYLGMPAATLRWYRYMGDRGPRSFRRGSRVVYRVEDLDAWLEAEYAATVRGGQVGA